MVRHRQSTRAVRSGASAVPFGNCEKTCAYVACGRLFLVRRGIPPAFFSMPITALSKEAASPLLSELLCKPHGASAVSGPDTDKETARARKCHRHCENIPASHPATRRDV